MNLNFVIEFGSFFRYTQLSMANTQIPIETDRMVRDVVLDPEDHLQSQMENMQPYLLKV